MAATDDREVRVVFNYVLGTMLNDPEQAFWQANSFVAVVNGKVPIPGKRHMSFAESITT